MRRGSRLLNLTVVWLALACGAIYLVLAVDANLIPRGPGVQNEVGNATGTDFIAYYTAGEAALEGSPADAYDVENAGERQRALLEGDAGVLPWAYPPIFLLLVIPLAALSYYGALAVWLGGTFGGLLAAGRRLFTHRAALLLVAIFPGVTQSNLTGQNGCLTAALFAGGMLHLKRRPVLSGVLFGLLVYKPHLAVLFPLCLAAGRHFQALKAMLVTGAGLALLSLLTLGVDPWLAFFEQAPTQLGYLVERRIAWERMPTVFVATLHATDQVAWARLAQVASTLVALGVAAWIWFRTPNMLPRTLGIAASVFLASPYAFDYDTALLVVPFLILIESRRVLEMPPVEKMVLFLLWTAPWILWFFSDWLGQQVGPLFFGILLVYAWHLTRTDPAATSSPTWAGTRERSYSA